MIMQAGNPDYDVAIVGAGPAGAATALLLSREGIRVLLTDRCELPRSKVCGGCLNRATLAALDQLGIGQAATGAGGERYDHMRLVSDRMSACLPLPRGAVIDRSAFDQAIVRAAEDEGAVVLGGTSASAIRDCADDAHVLRMTPASGHAFQVQARIVVDASGLSSTLFDRGWRSIGPARIGLGAIVDVHVWGGPLPDPRELLMCSADEGYVGIAWLAQRRLNVAAAFEPQAVKMAGGPGRAVASVLHQAGVETGAMDVAWHGSPRMNRMRSQVAGHRWFRVGDATGYVEPFTGEGIAWALAGAMRLVPHIKHALHEWKPKAAQAWTRDVNRFRARHRICRTATWALRHKHVRKSIVRAISAAPVLAQPMTASINRPEVTAHA